MNKTDRPRKSSIISSNMLPTYLAIVAAFAAVFVAFALRAYRIDGQSLWYDEGVSAAMSQRDFLTIAVDAAADIHPPLYYYLLHIWSWVSGNSELALRWLSLSFGVLLIAVVFKLAQRLFGQFIGVLAAFLTTFATFQIYYSQEARMYIQVTFFGALSTYLLLSIAPGLLSLAPDMTGPIADGTTIRPRGLIAYVVASIALLYSHYFAFTILAVQNVWMLTAIAAAGGSPSIRLRRLVHWIGLQLIIVIAFVPWLILSFGQLIGWPSISPPMTLNTLLYDVFHIFTFGLSWDAVATPRKEQFFFLLLAAAMFGMGWRFRRRYLALILTLLYAILPVLVMYALSLRRPMYNPKFLLLATPGYYILLAIGLSSLGQALASAATWLLSRASASRLFTGARRWVAFGSPRSSLGIGLAIVLLLPALLWMTTSTRAYYSNPKYARDDYRGLASFIQSRAQPDDAIILDAPGQVEIFDYYFKGHQAVYPLPQERPMDNQKTEAALKKISAEHHGIWLVLWAQTQADPQQDIERWLDQNTFQTGNAWFGGIRLAQYVVASGNAARWHESPHLTFGDSINLNDVSLDSTIARPGEFLDVTLDWQTIKPIASRYAVFVHLIDAHEYIWGQHDGEPGGGKKITTSWTTGEVVEDRHGMQILPGTPPGHYQLELGLYDATTGRRLPIANSARKPLGDRFLFGQIDVAKATTTFKPDALGMEETASATFGDGLRLLGFDFQRIGQSGPGVEFRSGDVALATLYWQTVIAPKRDYSTVLEVVDRNGKVMLRHVEQPAEGNYPTTQWMEGELVRDQHKLPLANLGPGSYVLRLGLIDGATGAPVLARSESSSSLHWIQTAKFRIQ